MVGVALGALVDPWAASPLHDDFSLWESLPVGRRLGHYSEGLRVNRQNFLLQAGSVGPPVCVIAVASLSHCRGFSSSRSEPLDLIPVVARTDGGEIRILTL